MTSVSVSHYTDVDPYTAIEALRQARSQADIVLPSLSVEISSPDLELVELGSVRADVAMRLARALQQESAPPSAEAGRR